MAHQPASEQQVKNRRNAQRSSTHVARAAHGKHLSQSMIRRIRELAVEIAEDFGYDVKIDDLGAPERMRFVAEIKQALNDDIRQRSIVSPPGAQWRSNEETFYTGSSRELLSELYNVIYHGNITEEVFTRDRADIFEGVFRFTLTMFGTHARIAYERRYYNGKEFKVSRNQLNELYEPHEVIPTIKSVLDIM